MALTHTLSWYRSASSAIPGVPSTRRRTRLPLRYRDGHATDEFRYLQLVVADRKVRKAERVAAIISVWYGRTVSPTRVRTLANQLQRGWGQYVI